MAERDRKQEADNKAPAARATSLSFYNPTRKEAAGLVVALLESSDELWGCRESREEPTSLHKNATSSKDTLTCKELKLEQKMIKQFHKKSPS